jgi:SEC-C motif-containing protein
MDDKSLCPCGSNKEFSVCCYPYISGRNLAPNAEALMRSRYSAYAGKYFQYIANTYATFAQSDGVFESSKQSQTPVSVEDIKASSEHTCWCKLEVLRSSAMDLQAEVEFIAYYQLEKAFYAMHERSRFVKADGKWLYVDGQMLDKTGSVKIGRNDSCLCGSGKKFKRCCHV